MCKLMVAIVPLLFVAGSAFAQSIGGLYDIQGTNFDGSPYGGEARITQTSKVTCEIVWYTGNVTSSGICMRSGNVFSAGYELDGSIGLVIYDVQGDGSLDGSWTIAGRNGVGYELLVPK